MSERIYRLSVEVLEKNPNYDQELTEANKQRQYGTFSGDMMQAREYLPLRHLETTLSADEFDAVRKAVLTVMK